LSLATKKCIVLLETSEENLMKHLLIIGGVAAGATAAARARRLDNDVEITLLEAGADVSFANCGLPYYLGRDIEYRSSLILASEETLEAGDGTQQQDR
jgi:NADPH-dependent 2,4-dienoyl-CoA reductase/sulfur reductase-like enzyme